MNGDRNEGGEADAGLSAGPRWVVVCNMTDAARPGWERGGSRVFAPGAKLYAGRLSGDAAAMRAIGLGRTSRRLASAFQPLKRLTNARPQLVYSAALIGRLMDLECRFFGDRWRAQLTADFINRWWGLVTAGVPEPVANYLPAAERGDARACFEIGALHERGHEAYRAEARVAVDVLEAARWYREAAEQGHPVAALRLARRLQNGDGLARDESEARRLYGRLAEDPDVRRFIENRREKKASVD